MISDFYISVGVTLIIYVEVIFKHNSKSVIGNGKIVMFWLTHVQIIWFSQVFGPTVPKLQDLSLQGWHG